MNEQLTEEEKDDIAQKIDSEGFNYYFTCYGPDEKLKRIIGSQIKSYQEAQAALEKALYDIGVDVNL